MPPPDRPVAIFTLRHRSPHRGDTASLDPEVMALEPGVELRFGAQPGCLHTTHLRKCTGLIDQRYRPDGCIENTTLTKAIGGRILARPERLMRLRINAAVPRSAIWLPAAEVVEPPTEKLPGGRRTLFLTVRTNLWYDLHSDLVGLPAGVSVLACKGVHQHEQPG